jgi:hypothetical protein
VMIAQPKQKTARNNKVRTQYRVMVPLLNLLACFSYTCSCVSVTLLPN